MNILFISGNILDLDQLSSTQEETGCLQLTFKNGDKVSLQWRDEYEKRDILLAVPSRPS